METCWSPVQRRILWCKTACLSVYRWWSSIECAHLYNKHAVYLFIRIIMLIFHRICGSLYRLTCHFGVKWHVYLYEDWRCPSSIEHAHIHTDKHSVLHQRIRLWDLSRWNHVIAAMYSIVPKWRIYLWNLLSPENSETVAWDFFKNRYPRVWYMEREDMILLFNDPMF